MLKNTIKTMLITITLMISGLWAEDGAKTPEAIGKQAFAILKNLDNEDFQSFRAKLTSKEELLAFAKENMKDKKKLQKAEKLFNQSFEEELHETFDELKAKRSEKIYWSNIIFKGFIFNDFGDDEIKKGKVYTGNLYFSSNTKNFKVKTRFILHKGNYRIMNIYSSSPVSDEKMKEIQQQVQ